MKKCDDCKQQKTECLACRARSQARADHVYDELRVPTLADELSHQQQFYGQR